MKIPEMGELQEMGIRVSGRPNRAELEKMLAEARAAREASGGAAGGGGLPETGRKRGKGDSYIQQVGRVTETSGVMVVDNPFLRGCRSTASGRWC
jgi:hypothetical protein